jgi:hypothetical protein
MSASDARHGRRGFRRWRRTRPFWGGVFTVASGIEIILIPLAPTGVTIHQGIAGVGSWLAGMLLIVSGLLMWFQPQQRSFFGVLAVLLSLASFVTSNLGGFLFGMLLGLVGGALGFAWAPHTAKAHGGEPGPEPGGGRHRPRGDDHGSDPRGDDLGPDPRGDDHRPQPHDSERPYGSARASAEPNETNRPPSRYLSLALLPALLGAGLMGTPARQTAASAAGCNWFTSVFGCTAPSPSPSSPAPLPVPLPGATRQPGAGSAQPGVPAAPGDTGACDTGSPPLTTAKPGAGASCPTRKNCPAPKPMTGQSAKEMAKEIAKAAPCAKPGKARSAPAGQARTSTDPATLNASSLTMSGLHYDGVVELPTSTGSPVRMLRFSMEQAVLDNVDQHFGRGARPARLRAGTLTLDGGVVMYTSKMKSKLFGVLPLTFTPEHPPPLVPSKMFMTDVVSEQASVVATSAALKGLDLSL